MVQSLENIDKSKVSATRIEGLEGVVEDTINNTLTGAVSTITTSDLTANKVLVSDANGKVAAGSIKVSDIPTDSDLVHKSGNETIAGTKTFTSEINGYLKSYTATNNDSAASPYKKIGECVISGTYKSVVVPFLYSKTSTSVDDGLYTGKIMLRVDGTAGTFANANSGFILSVFPDAVKNDEIIFYLCYKNNYPTNNDVTCQFWIYVKHTYNGINILPLRQGVGGSSSSTSQITWGSNLVEATNLPSGYTSIKHIFTNGNIETPVTSDNSTKIATTAYVKAQGYAADSGVVHTSGNETINGTKTFSSTISGDIDGNAATVTNGVYTTGNQTIAGNKTFSGTTVITGQLQSKRNNNDARILNYYANYTKGTAPSATQYSGIRINDNAGTEIADFYSRISTSNINSAFMVVKDPGTGTTTKQIAIHFPADGTAYTEAPTPATSDDSTKIATTAWVKNQGYITSDSDTKNTAGSTDTSSKIFLIGATSQAANPQTYSHDTVFVNTSGQLQTPTPGNDSNTTVAATTAFVKNVLKTSGAGLYTISKAANGYCKFNGGLIVQWGTSTVSGTNIQITFPTAFTSTNYYAHANEERWGDTANGWGYVADRTKTSCYFMEENCNFHWIAIGY